MINSQTINEFLASTGIAYMQQVKSMQINLMRTRNDETTNNFQDILTKFAFAY